MYAAKFICLGVLCAAQWLSGLRHVSTADRLLGLRVRIPPGTWTSVCCKCCVLSGRDLCDGPIPRPEESYRLWCVIVCDLQASRMRRPWSKLGCCARKNAILFFCLMALTKGRNMQHPLLCSKGLFMLDGGCAYYLVKDAA